MPDAMIGSPVRRTGSDIGAAAREQRAAAFDAWLATLLPAGLHGVALVAVGGLGRRELAPYSDLDLLLLHGGVGGADGIDPDSIDPDSAAGPASMDDVAAAIWYPIWDAKVGLDHSVRTLPEALHVAEEDVKVALGLLDARHVAGDAALTARLVTSAADLWRRTAIRQLARLREQTAARHQAHGELAFLLEGDLKQAAGGLRDAGVLRGIGFAGVSDAFRPVVRAAQRRLLDARDALHVATGRRVDRLVAQERSTVAALLELEDGDALLRRVSSDARTITYALDDAWRAVDRMRAVRRRSTAPASIARRPVARDVVEQDGEVVLARAAVGPRPEPSLSLRVAAAAATARLPVARATLEWLVEFCPPLPTPWPQRARLAFVTLLGAGHGLVPTWEACDRYGLVAGWLPEWARVRSLPQHNPVHLYTLDRHLVQAAAEAGRFTREVDRPDLLLLAAFLHDMGKGLPGDHSQVGAPIAAAVATRVGLAPADVALVAKVVRLHLLLPEVATRRDLADPVTIRRVAEAVGDATTLDLLYGVARADAAATGPAAWSHWKGLLVEDLVGRVRAALRGAPLPAPPAPAPELVTGPLPAILLEGDRVAVAATDRRGLLAAVAGCLSLHRLEVVAADATTVDGRALVEFRVQPRYGTGPDTAALAIDLRRAVLGDVSVTQRLRGRAGAGRGSGAAPRVVWHREAATDAVVLELRAADSPGLLYRVASALDESGAYVRAARISTLGGDVVDAFYLVGGWPDEAARDAVGQAVRTAAG